MTSDYRRDHLTSPANDELDALNATARGDIAASVTAFDSLYPLPVASSGETRALQRAYARYLLDSGKASTSNVLAGDVDQPPVNLTLPVITGGRSEGSTLTCSPGTWLRADSLAYQWKRDGVAISGATASTRVIAAADLGTTLTCTVTATSTIGSVSATSAGIALASGILFDTSGTDDFTDLLAPPANAAFTITDGSIAYSSAVDLGSGNDNFLVPTSDGVNPLILPFDIWTAESTHIVTSLQAAAARGVMVGGQEYIPAVTDGMWGHNINAAGWAGTAAFINTTAFGNILSTNEIIDPLATHTIRVRSTNDGQADEIRQVININGGADLSHTDAYGVGSFAGTTARITACLRFHKGVHSCTNLKFTAAYPNAKYAFVGDSLTAWRETGFAKLARDAVVADGTVLIAGVSGATTEDWAPGSPPTNRNIIESVVLMNPQYAFICLGTNDRVGSHSVARSQAAMTSILAELVAADITPIIISSPPMNANADVATFNTWLAGLGHRYINIHTYLGGGGTSLTAPNDYGDGVHWSSAAHIGVADIITDYITAEAL